MQKDFTIDSKTNWTSLLNGGRPAVGDPEHVPAGIYAKKHCKTGRMGYALSKLAPAEDVRGALALVERNEAPLGIVYGSDAVASKGVKWLPPSRKIHIKSGISGCCCGRA